MTDRELLELAAKAAGMVVVSDYDGAAWAHLVDEHPEQAVRWNPLTDDGDALRLAVTLRIEYIFVSDRKSIQCMRAEHTEMGDWETYLCDEPIGDDVQASMRKAIVRAATEIGKRGA